MARTVRDVRLDSRAARERLAPQKKPYWRVIESARHIGYYKGTRGGTWLARAYVGNGYREAKLGAADDVRDANGMDVLSFSAAQAAARAWFDELCRVKHGGREGPFTVGDACDLYLEWQEQGGGRYGGKDIANTRSRLDRIKDELGSIELSELTAGQVRAWFKSISEAGRLTRSRSIDKVTGSRIRLPLNAQDDDAVRRRKASANRMLSVLKAALNHAVKEPPAGVAVPGRGAWEVVTPHKAVDEPKVEYLTDDEARRLLNACPSDFKDLVGAALLTGCRYGELCRLVVRDFDESANAIRVALSKAGKPRSIALTDEGTALFARLARGQGRDALLLRRDDGGPWLASQQLRRIAEARKAAGIGRAISFHVLRHTYASRLAMRGAPMPVIAAQLGHASTRMTERHYAHLGPSYVSNTVRELLGLVGMPTAAENVVAIGGASRAT